MATLIIAPVGLNCNLACSYCYEKDLHRNSPVMSLDELAIVYREWKEIAPEGTIFIWHGGEPCLMGSTLFGEAIAMQKYYYKSQKNKILNLVQTNGTLLDKHWLTVFSRYRVRVSVSLDGSAIVHDRHRKNCNGDGTFSLVLETVLKLKKAKLLQSVLSVVTPETAIYLEDSYEFFLKNNLTNLEFTPAFNGKPVDNSIIEGLTVLFKRWFTDDNPKIYIRMFWGIVRALYGGKPLTCGFAQGGCKSYLAIDSDLNVFPCVRLMGRPEYLLGNLRIRSLKAILESKQYNLVLSQLLVTPKVCKSCKWLAFCGSGCPAERQEASLIYPPDCSLKQKLFHYAKILMAH